MTQRTTRGTAALKQIPVALVRVIVTRIVTVLATSFVEPKVTTPTTVLQETSLWIVAFHHCLQVTYLLFFEKDVLCLVFSYVILVIVLIFEFKGS